MAYLSRSSRAASARTLTIGLVSEAWASSSIVGVRVRQAQVREFRAGHEARVGWVKGGSREVVVAVIIVVGDPPY